MNEAAYELLERLAQTTIAALYREHGQTKQPQMKLHIHVEINDIEELLDKARHEQKGGT